MIISRSEDGISFEEVKVIRQADFAGRKVKSIERCSLFIDPWTGLFKLYLAIDQEFRNWVIVKLDDVESPEGFDASTAQVVLARSGYGSDSKSVKDPFIMTVGRQYYMFYIGNSTRCELPHLATSVDGVNWKRFEGNPIMAGTGWHEFCLRIACVMPLAQGYAVFYEGASLNEIIREAEISKGSLYYYFEDKTDLYLTVIKNVMEDMFAEIGGITVGEFSDDFWADVENYFKQMIKMILSILLIN